MLYFDNAGTSFPKPAETKAEVIHVMEHYGANPGRGGYAFAKETSRYMSDARKEIADFLGVTPFKHLIFTSGATEGMNIVLKSCLKRGEHLLYTGAEHNATTRPVKWLESVGIEATKVPVSGNKINDLKTFEGSIRENTRLIVVNHGSNIFGYIQPLDEIIALAKKYDLLVLADMAQTAGFLNLKIAASGIDFAAFAGHKSLMGYGGIGALYIREPFRISPLIHGGTGNMSHLLNQPPIMPTGFEAGTRNVVGIGSLLGGVRFLKSHGVDHIREHEASLTAYFLEGLKNLSHITVYGFPEIKERLPVVSLNVGDLAPEKVAEMLDQKAQICVRAGLHCSPAAHETMGTLNRGTVRFSFGAFNTKEEIDTALNVLETMK